MECRQANSLIHELLDGDIDELSNRQLQEHLSGCATCKQHLQELRTAIMFVQSTSHVHISADFTARVLAELPAPSRTNRFTSWLRHHPMLAAAAVFFVLMTGSLSATWFEQDNTLQVSSSSMDKLKIDKARNVVVVPSGVTVDGDLVVRNGSVEVQGQVKGNVVAIEGKVFLASTAQVAGQTESIEAIFDWMWYELKNLGNDLLPVAP